MKHLNATISPRHSKSIKTLARITRVLVHKTNTQVLWMGAHAAVVQIVRTRDECAPTCADTEVDGYAQDLVCSPHYR